MESNATSLFILHLKQIKKNKNPHRLMSIKTVKTCFFLNISKLQKHQEYTEPIMAAMSLIKNCAFNLSKAISHNPSSLFAPAAGKVSRVCFTSATNRPVKLYCVQGQHAASDDHLRKGPESDMADKTKESMDRAKEKTEELKEKAKEKTEELKEKAKERAEEMKGKTSDMASKAADKAEETKEKTKETAYDIKEKTKDASGTMADKTKETAEALAEKTKETVKGAWDLARDTSQKIKETVICATDDKDPIDEFMEDHVGPSKRESVQKEKSGGGWRPSGKK